VTDDSGRPVRLLSIGETPTSGAFDKLSGVSHRHAEGPTDVIASFEGEQAGCLVCAPDDADWDAVALVETVADHDGDITVVVVTENDLDRFVDAGVVGMLAEVVRPGETDALVSAVERAVAAVRERANDREVSSRYRSLVEESPTPIVIFDAEGNIELANDALASLLGVTDADELVGQHASNYIADDALKTSQDRLEQVIDDRTSTPAAQRTLVDVDGEEKYVIAAMQPVVYDGERAAQAVLGNVTEHKHLQSALRAQRDQFSALFEHLNEPVVATEFEGETPVVSDMNVAFAETFGVDTVADTGKPVDELIVPAEDRADAASFNRRAKAGKRLEVEVRRQTPDGPRDFLLRFVPYGSGDSRGGYAIYIDVTERREWERQLQRQNERLEEVARVVSHDLRNPLNVAAGTVDVLARRADDDGREAFERVQRAHDRIEAIITDMLALAREGQSVTDLSPVDLSVVARDAWETVETGGATLDIRASTKVMADASRLQQAFENLFANAVTHGGEDVTVIVGEMPECPTATDRDRDRPTRDDDHPVRRGGFFVADDGSGIPADERDDVFESGFSTGEDSTGFGLSIVQSIVEAHGWDVAVTDRIDGTSGARFEITGVEYAETNNGERPDSVAVGKEGGTPNGSDGR